MAALNQDRAQAEAAVEQWRVAGWTGREVYLKLNEVTGRLVVDKSPTSAASPEYLARALRWCPEARFLHLVRHPLAMMESFTRMRMHHIVPQTTALDPWEAAERTWQASERNVRDFFAWLSERQRFRIRYEDLVTAPGPTLRNLCDWLDLPYDPQMLDAYGPDRMTDSIAGEKSQIGDPNFHRRDAIDPALADAWRAVRAPRGLDPQTIVLAEACGYVLDGEGEEGGQGRAVGPSLPSPAPPAEDAIPEDVEWDLPDGPLAGLRWGSTEARAVLCVHGHREQSLVWLSVARRLVSQGYQVIAPDLRGHGRSPHLHGAGGYPFSVLLRDLAALMDRLPHLEIIVGHSLGGVLCQIVASGSTKKLRGLVLVDVPTPLGRSIVSPSPDLETLIRPRIPKHAPLESREAAAERLCKASPELDPTFALALAERILKPVSNGWKWRWDPRLELPLDGAPLDLHKTIRPDRLPNTAAIFGSRSPLTRSEDLAWVRAVGGRTMLVDAAHHPHLAYPEKVASLVAALQSSGGAPCAPGVSILAGPTPDDLPSGSQSK
jgi:pimeloyl-ACP methyl ester carboxylesterase